jgi:hypothetical protein
MGWSSSHKPQPSPLADILFVGDALYIGGNDHAVLDAGVDGSRFAM